MLIENTLFGINDKVKIAIERIKTFEPMAVNINPLGYYVCISGGKDSSVIQELCIMAGVKCEFIHNHTSVDHPETVRFIRREMERIKNMGGIFRIEYPRYRDGRQKTMWNLIEKKGFPSRFTRYCCEQLKEFGGTGRYCITGVRWEESQKRKKSRFLHESSEYDVDKKIMLNNDNDMKRRLSESCIPKRKFILNPIIDWTRYDVWDFLHEYKVPYNPLYDTGKYERVGCVGCPLSRKKKFELEENKKYKNAYFKAGIRYIEYRKSKIKEGEELPDVLKTPEKYFDWFLHS
jgi:phosphoadenosine phosphosulfate reductase